jgi:uncharacterized YigZ family protein
MNSDDTFKTLSVPGKGLYREKGSRFIARSYPVSSEDQIRNALASLRKEFHDARHHCYAYCLGPDKSAWRVNDDGEPSGSAGKPIFGQIQSNEITDVLIVVIRYFGGTKLGIPGLINAYRTAAKEAIDTGGIVTRIVEERIQVQFEYPLMNSVMKILKEENAGILEQRFDTDCELVFSIRRSLANHAKTRLSGIQGIRLSTPEESLLT